MKTKKEKAEYLKGLLKGDRTIDELNPDNGLRSILMSSVENPELFHDSKGNAYTREEAAKLAKRRKAMVIEIVDVDMREDENLKRTVSDEN